MSSFAHGGDWVQTARSRDVGLLLLVVGFFVILLVVSIVGGTPPS